MNKIELPWGRDSLEVTLPPTWRVLGERVPAEDPEPADLEDLCARSLASPIEARRLGERDLSSTRVVLVVDDHSRPTPVASFIGPVLDELGRAGARDENLEILVATGVHRASTPEEVERKVGPGPFRRLRWTCHSAYDAGRLVDLGTTTRGTRVLLNRRLIEADLVVCLGAVEPHLLLGFGGGLKMLIPGCAGAETVGRNHLQGVDPDHFDFVGADIDDSPMRQDLEEGAAMIGREVFLVNGAVNARGRPVRFFCGHPERAHREATGYVREQVGLRVPSRADVVLTNSFPMDSDLRQSIKCVGNTLHASKPGGVMLGCVRCTDGLGEMPVPDRTLPYPILRALVRVLGKDRILPLVKRARKGQPVEEIFIGHFGLQMLRRNHLAVFSDSDRLPPDIGKRMGMCRSYTRVGEMVAWAKTKAPREATVWVFPYGGASFAIAP
jgi:nickel-dependent lactate racemase